jgi:glycosyltransferase involved in cell wall biosynthesis
MRIGLIVPAGISRDGEYHAIPALLWLVERLANRHEVEVIALRQESAPATWSLLGATIHNVGMRPCTPRALGLVLKLHRSRPFDVFHAIWAGAPALVAFTAARLSGRPALVHAAGGELVSMPDIAFGSSRMWRAISRVVIRNADSVTAASECIIDLAKAAGAQPLRVPLGVATDRWTPSPPRPRPPNRPAKLVQVGSLTPVKGQAVLLRAMARLAAEGRDVQLDLVGYDAYGGAIQRLAQELGLSSRITFHGFLPQSQVLPVVRGADLMVVSSRHEAGPLAFLEAAIVGVPTVGTDVGHVRDFAPDAAIAVDVGDFVALAREIGSLLDDEPRRLAIATRAHERALREDADWTCARFEDLYAEAIASGRSRVRRAEARPPAP